MHELPLLIAFIMMTLLFLRQLVLLKHFAKINYAALQLSIAVFGTLIYIATAITTISWQQTLSNALFLLAAGVLFYMVMNVINQLRNRYLYEMREKRLETIEQKNATTREQMQELFDGLQWLQESDSAMQSSQEAQIEQEQLNFASIIKNQQRFIDDVSLLLHTTESITAQVHEELAAFKQSMHDEISEQLNHTSHDNEAVVNQLSHELNSFAATIKSVASQPQLQEKIAASFQNSVETFNKKLLESFKGYEKMVQSLRIQNESFQTALLEDEQRLISIKEQSEQLMQQLVLSKQAMSKQGETLLAQNRVFTALESKSNLLRDAVQTSIALLEQLNTNAHFTTSLSEALAPLKAEHTKLLEALHTELLEELQKHIKEVEAQFGYVDEKISQSVRTLKQLHHHNPYEQ